MELKINGASLMKCTLGPGEKEVIVPRGVRIIEWGAFSGCSALRRVVLPDGVFEIRRAAFQNCRRLMQINLPDRLRVVGESAFSGCEALQSVVMPDSVTTLGLRAFESCISLAQVRLSENLRRIESMAFYGCKKLQKLYIPDSVKEIGQGAFQLCVALAQVRCPDSMIAIEERAFRACLALKQIRLPEQLQQLGDQTFMNCTQLETLILPEGIVRLPDELCKNCAALTQIVLPASLDQRISRDTRGAFTDCRKLTRVIARGKLCPSVQFSFYGVDEHLEQLYVSVPESFDGDDCFARGISNRLMLLALRTYVSDQARFSQETQKKYDAFMRRHSLALCKYIIERADIMEYICRGDLLRVKDMPVYIEMALSKPAQLGRLLKHVCSKRTLDKEEVYSLIDKTTALEQNEATAVLLQYQNEYFPASSEDDEEDPFFLPSLDDDF